MSKNFAEMNKREKFAVLKELVCGSCVENEVEIVAFIDHEIELLTKKSSSNSEKSKAKKAENDSLKETILTVLAENRKAMTIGMLMTDERLPLTNQKLTYLLTQMVNTDKTIVRTVEKKVPYFSLAVAED